jgi:D-3-phosphoglycerate dehydrogenase
LRNMGTSWWPTTDWFHEGGMAELQHQNRLLEEGGPEAVPVPEEVYRLIEDAEIMAFQFQPVPRALLEAGKNLKAVGTLRAGLENLDVAAASQMGIMVFNNPGRNAHAVAEFAIGLLFAEARNICRCHVSVKEGGWRRHFINSPYTPELEGKTIGIIGLGQIGQLVAKKLAGFEPRYLGYDPYVDPKQVQYLGIEMVGLYTLLRESDFVTISARLTKENEHLLGRRELGLMKPTAFLINSARSGLIDEEALYQALKEKRIGGAALDVFDVEPPGKDYPLVTLDNCTVTSHMAGTTKDALLNAPKLLAQRMLCLVRGEGEPRFQVNKEEVGFRRLV